MKGRKAAYKVNRNGGKDRLHHFSKEKLLERRRKNESSISPSRQEDADEVDCGFITVYSSTLLETQLA
ncbi:hypothetical protein AVEN_81455-1 [Araneus ventricosus]|uniref:Uncharacterized protein n=1 Tax=Araneus ventricosus TaxID=182803 RepID=A0A4Y2QRI5_ARAVE|nr:hypothetical protein AVEN_81455-1 [Araneus ventricosus]